MNLVSSIHHSIEKFFSNSFYEINETLINDVQSFIEKSSLSQEELSPRILNRHRIRFIEAQVEFLKAEPVVIKIMNWALSFFGFQSLFDCQRERFDQLQEQLSFLETSSFEKNYASEEPEKLLARIKFREQAFQKVINESIVPTDDGAEKYVFGGERIRTALEKADLDDFQLMTNAYLGIVQENRAKKKEAEEFRDFAKLLKNISHNKRLLEGLPLFRDYYTPVTAVAKRGFKNEVNTCYLASVLQVIRHISSLRSLFDRSSNPLKKRDNETEGAFKRRNILQEVVSRELKFLDEDNEEAIRGISFVRETLASIGIIRKTDQGLASNEQLAGDEILLEMLDVVDGGLPLLVGLQRIVPSGKRTLGTSSKKEDLEQFRDLGTGQVCFTELRFPPYFFQKERPSLDDLFIGLQEEQIEQYSFLEGDQAYTSRAVQTTSIDKQAMPNHLCVNVSHGRERDKTPVNFPPEWAPFGEEGPSYRLEAALVHIGSDQCGHYVAYLRDSQGYFVEASDGSISSSQKWNKDLDTACMYFYVCVENSQEEG